KMAHETIKENVTSIAGVPSWTLVLIKKILSITGKDNLLEVWPNLELFMHGGISFIPYIEQYKKIIPSADMHYLETYNASEGFFGIQDDPNSSSMLLMLDYGIFYEFIPLENIHDETPKTLTIDQIELNKNYALVISTNSGLWRYIIGDTIKFTSEYPFKFIITGRIKHFINAFGEELIIDNAENALKIACERTNALINEYTAAPIYMDEKQKGCHQWLFEFDRHPNNIEHFIELLDNALKSVNSDYEAKRYKDISLTLPQIVCLKKGVFHEWLKRKGKLGGQHKIPRLANNRIYVDELLEINEEL
ncbi:MAG: GH3 auxin-responsive promoter family protein, partial [Bacteroidales bacterium]|nr:GH3 auxin-responsive promoter family protein [Bacteroidales bacterium]